MQFDLAKLFLEALNVLFERIQQKLDMGWRHNNARLHRRLRYPRQQPSKINEELRWTESDKRQVRISAFPDLLVQRDIDLMRLGL